MKFSTVIIIILSIVSLITIITSLIFGLVCQNQYYAIEKMKQDRNELNQTYDKLNQEMFEKNKINDAQRKLLKSFESAVSYKDYLKVWQEMKYRRLEWEKQ